MPRDWYFSTFNRLKEGRFFILLSVIKMIAQTDTEKLVALYKKLEEAEIKYRERLKRFRGVPHESAAGEMNFSELKVREDFVVSIRAEIKALEIKLKVPTKLSPRFP